MSRPAGTWITSVFHRTGMADPEAFPKLFRALLPALRRDGLYTGNNLIAFGRNLSFSTDPEFRDAFFAATPEPREQELAWRLHTLCWAARHGLSLPGDLVEAACYKGFSARVIANYLRFSEQNRTYWLYDAFDETPVPLPDHTDELHRSVIARFADLSNVRIVKGLVPGSMQEAGPERISFLHLDMNNVAAEIGALELFWERMSPGAVVILDDYGHMHYRAQRDAHDAWFAARDKRVLEMPTGQGMVIR